MNATATIPADQLFWAIVDPAILPRRHRGHSRQLGFLFERVLPISIGELHVVYSAIAADSTGKSVNVICCGMRQKQLEAYRGQCLCLYPESAPRHLSQAYPELDPTSLNLLTGPFEPPAVRRTRWATTVHIACVCLLLCGILIAGLLQRAHGLSEATDRIRDAQMTQLAGVVTSNGSHAQPLHLQLTAMVRELRRTRGESSPDLTFTDSGALLDGLLSRWPPHLHTLTESITVTGESMTIRARVPDAAAAQSLADAYKTPLAVQSESGANLTTWRLQQPKMSNAGEEVLVTVELTRDQLEPRVAHGGRS